MKARENEHMCWMGKFQDQAEKPWNQISKKFQVPLLRQKFSAVSRDAAGREKKSEEEVKLVTDVSTYGIQYLLICCLE